MTLTPFSNSEFQLDIIPDGDTFRVLAPSLAKSLGMREAYDLLRSVPDDEKGSEIVRTPGGGQRVGYLTEAGFYRALGQRQTARIARSDVRAQVDRFQKWVYAEVLPSIRKTGSYGVARELTADEIVAQALAITTERVKALTATVETQQARLAVVEPKASAFDRWLSSNCNYAVGDVAKALACAGVEIGRQRLFTHMGAARDQGGLGWIYRDPRGQWQPYQSQIETKRLAVKLGTQLNSRTGEDFETVTVRITPKGATALAVAFGAIPEVVAEALETLEGAAA